MPTTITSAGVTFNDTTSLTSANGVPSALKLTTARTINGVSFDGTANITVPASGTSAAKAWVNFNGITGAIRASFNVSSITRHGTPNTDGSGDITISFTNPNLMADTNYVVLGTGTSNGVDASYGTFAIRADSITSSPNSMTRGEVRIIMGGSTNKASNYNSFTVTVAIFGN